MLRLIAAAALVAFAAGSASPASVTVDLRDRSVTPAMIPLPAHAVGRMQVAPLGPPMPAGAVAYIHQWPGVYFEAAFSGERVVLAFADPANEYRLLIDDRPPIPIVRPGDAEIRVGGLGPGRHRLRLEQVTESGNAPGVFRGFYIPPDQTAGAVAPRARQIEFIGDSIMSGFGARAGKFDCAPGEARLTSDTQDAYAALTAKALYADYQINAISGRGLIRNFGGLDPEGAMLRTYPYVFLDRTRPYADPHWRPQIIVIRLIADFVSPLKPGEPWTDFDQVARDYVQGYAALIGELHARDPGATILVQWPDAAQLGDAAHFEAFEAMRRAIEAAADQAGATVRFFPLDVDQSEGAACAHHPSPRTQATMAAALTAYIAAHPEYWRGR